VISKIHDGGGGYIEQVYLLTPMDRATLLQVKSTIMHCPPSIITRQRALVNTKLLRRPRTVGNLARSAKLLTGLYILLALISFFSMITWRKIISGSAGLIFAIFAPNDMYLFVDDRSGPVFESSRDVAMATN